MLNAVELEEHAYQGLIAGNIKELAPGFTTTSIVRAARRALHIVTMMHELKDGGMDGNGIEPMNINCEALPIEKRRRFIYRFSITTDKEKSAVENIIEKSKWPEQFDIEKMCQDNAQPFLHRSIPLTGVVEAFFLSRVVASPADEVNYDHLKDPRHLKLKETVKNEHLVKTVVDRLNSRGKRIFYNDIEEKAYF
ncbi:unnamed protein product [Caenorhabditis brenneri]